MHRAAPQAHCEMQCRAAGPAQPLQRVLRDQPRRAQGRAQRFSDPAQMRDVEAIDHHPAEQRELRQWRTQPREMRAELGAVECHRLQHAPARRRTEPLRIIIRIGFHRLQANFRVGFEPGDRLRPTRKESGTQARVDGLGHRARQILDCIRNAVRKPRFFHLGIGGDPDHAAGPRRGAADKRGLLDHQHT